MDSEFIRTKLLEKAMIYYQSHPEILENLKNLNIDSVKNYLELNGFGRYRVRWGNNGSVADIYRIF